MITYNNHYFKLDTSHTSYCFKILDTKHLEHLYYGPYLHISSIDDLKPLETQRVFPIGNSISYDENHLEYNLEAICQEVSTTGMGDIREPMITLTYHDGYQTSDFIYKSHTIDHEEPHLNGLPSSYGECDHLCIILEDNNTQILLELHYHVYEQYDVITRYHILKNNTDKSITINKIMSNQIDFDDTYTLTTFNGTWAREMNKNIHDISCGTYINESRTGTSSSRANPFMMLSHKDTNENMGLCYGFNLVYSGNHYESISVNAFNQTRLLQGIHPDYFEYTLEPDESFVTPEAIMSTSQYGYNDLSHHFHEFINHCIVRGEWKNKERPILINSWEANYFNIDEKKLLKLAKKASSIGIELFVVDDGWFGHRDDDTSSLGDWYVNKKKLPGGLSSLSHKLKQMHMDLGIWVEPEMVSEDSELYREHPDWVLKHPTYHHSLGRHQMVLDLSRQDVVDYLYDALSKVFSSAEISYVKWDMNRNISEYYSLVHSSKEVSHRYVLGLYQLMDRLTKAFPHILFEGCASGGNRFDLGILCYFPQIWASDDTDALYRVEAQQNYSYGYPLSAISSHVSASINHQTLRHIPLHSRFHVSCFGILGYELQLNDLSNEELDTIQQHISFYKQYRSLFQYGTFYRTKQKLYNWNVVDKDKNISIAMIMQVLNHANDPYHKVYLSGLIEDKQYSINNIPVPYNIKSMGDLINTATPIHIKQGSLSHEVISRFVKLNGEIDECVTTGSILKHHGYNIKPAYGGTGYSDDIRLFTDFDSRMYVVKGDK